MSSGMAGPVPGSEQPTPRLAFISYASEDVAWAGEICRLLELAGVPCWMADRDVRGEASRSEEIVWAIESTPVTVVLLSSRANVSLLVEQEVERATSKGKGLIPVRIEDVRPSRTLELFVSSRQWINAWDVPLARRIPSLAQAIRQLARGNVDRTRTLNPAWMAYYGAGAGRPRDRRLGGRAIAGLGIGGVVTVFVLVAASLAAGYAGLWDGTRSQTPGPPTPTPAASPPSPPDSKSVAAADLVEARQNHRATLLADGRVLVTGGRSGTRTLASAEIYDPATGVFKSTVGQMTFPRFEHSATLLADGRVLVTGGRSYGAWALASAEIYDPATGVFESTGAMTVPRFAHSATLLADGRVLVAGGSDGAWPLESAELYDPASGRFESTGAMANERRLHSATLLADGRVLVAGGDSRGSTELYDPTHGVFTQAGLMIAVRRDHTASLLGDGRVLLAGGQDNSDTALGTAEIYDPATNTCKPTGMMTTARRYHAASLLLDGRVLVTGGEGSHVALDTVELYNPSTGVFAPVGAMTVPRELHSATTLKDGRVLLIGGLDGATNALASSEVYRS